MSRSENYYPKRKTEIEIPDFLQSKEPENFPGDNVSEELINQVSEGLQKAIEEGENERVNGYHLKQLYNSAEAFTEDEAKAVIKSLVNNYPSLMMEELTNYITEMQELAGSIIKNCKAFSQKRG